MRKFRASIQISDTPNERCLGQPTRGKTAPNRLRQTDVFLAIAFPGIIQTRNCRYVDLGYGESPITTLETWERLQKINPSIQVLGVEIDPNRVTDARPFTQENLEFRLGGFNLPVAPDERVNVIRVFNVLRQYEEADVEIALQTLGQSLAPGGLILEGTCDPTGRFMAFQLFRKRNAGDIDHIGLVFAPRLRSEFYPRQLQSILPKSLIHHAEPGGAVDQFFSRWHICWQAARAQFPGQAQKQIFAQAALRLKEIYGYHLDQRLTLLKRGFLVLSQKHF